MLFMYVIFEDTVVGVFETLPPPPTPKVGPVRV